MVLVDEFYESIEEKIPVTVMRLPYRDRFWISDRRDGVEYIVTLEYKYFNVGLMVNSKLEDKIMQ